MVKTFKIYVSHKENLISYLKLYNKTCRLPEVIIWITMKLWITLLWNTWVDHKENKASSSLCGATKLSTFTACEPYNILLCNPFTFPLLCFVEIIWKTHINDYAQSTIGSANTFQKWWFWNHSLHISRHHNSVYLYIP